MDGSLQTDYATWLSVFNVNLFGAAILSRTLYPELRQAGFRLNNSAAV